MSACAVPAVTGFDSLVHCLFNLRILDMVAGSDSHGALNSTSGSDKNSVS